MTFTRDKTSLHSLAMSLEINLSDLEIVAGLLDSALEDSNTDSAIWLTNKLKGIHKELEQDMGAIYEFKAAMNKAEAA